MNCRISTSFRLFGIPHKKNRAVTRMNGRLCPAGKSLCSSFGVVTVEKPIVLILGEVTTIDFTYRRADLSLARLAKACDSRSIAFSFPCSSPSAAAFSASAFQYAQSISKKEDRRVRNSEIALDDQNTGTLSCPVQLRDDTCQIQLSYHLRRNRLSPIWEQAKIASPNS